MAAPLLSTRIVLVRHGQAGGPGQPYGPDAGLTAAGFEQSRRLVSALRDMDAARLYSSHYRRALETAHPLVQALHLPHTVDERLAEFHTGEAQEQSIEEIVAELRYLMLWRPHDQGMPGGETLGAFQHRVSTFLDEVVRHCLGRTAVIVSHAGAIAAAMRWAYGLSPDQDWHSDVEVFNASLTEIEYWPEGRHPEGAPHAAAIRRLNDVRHLPPDLVTAF